jgi:hypothetical protein
MVQSPGTIEAGTPAADQAQSDLTIAYNDAAGRTADFTTATTQLGGLSLIGGVYAAPGKAALGLTGTLTLDGGGDSTSVFIFQTNFALDTAAASNIVLINGAQECNVFWQVGASATLGASSTFVGSILAQTAITVGAAVNFHGHALARDAAVTLATDIFTDPTCAVVAPTTTTTELPTTTTEPETTTSIEAETTTTTEPETTTSIEAETTTTTEPETTTSIEAETTTTTEPETTTSIEAETTTTTEPATTTEPVTTPTTVAETTTTAEVVSADASLAVSTTDPQAVSTTLSAAATAATVTASTTARAELPLTGITARIIILSALSTLLLGILTIYVSREEKL